MDERELRELLTTSTTSIRIVHTFTHGKAVQLYTGNRKASPLIFPSEDQTLRDVMAMLGELAQ